MILNVRVRRENELFIQNHTFIDKKCKSTMSIEKIYNIIKRAKVKQKEAPITKISLGEIIKILCTGA